MSVELILGASGTGKSTYIYEQLIKKSQEQSQDSLIFILPEQANLAAEKEMVRMHPNGGTMDISILSFTRLAFKVFDECNVYTKDILDDYGKNMLIMKILKQHQEELCYYRSMIGKQGFVEEMKSVLSEFYQYQITEEILGQTIANLTPDKSLFHKLSDLKVLLHAFDEEMKDTYMIAEQLLSLLKEVAHSSTLLKGADIYFDGFTGFTPVQYTVIEELMKIGCHLHFSFTMDSDLFGDNGYSEHGLFALSKQAVDRLCSMAQQQQVAVLPHIEFTRNYRHMEHMGLMHMERQLFRFPIKEYEKNCEEIQLFSSKNVKDEIAFIATMIQNYVMKQGYRYRDFAIVTGDIQTNCSEWKRIMDLHNVPIFLDYNEPMLNNPMVEMLEYLFEIFRMDYSYDSIFALLKTGFFDIEEEGIYALENYVIQYGVKGYSKWKKPFLRKFVGIEEVNETRKKVIALLEPFREIFSKRQETAKEYLVAVYEFMVSNQIAQKLYKRGILLEQEGRLRESKAYLQVYDTFLEVLDKTMDILGEEKIERDVFVEVLKSGIRDLKLGLIPSTLDQVIIGDIERTRLQHVKILFVAGLNEGILPKKESETGILADRDRQQLKELQVSLAPDSKEEMFAQQFYWYLQIAQASEKLIMLYRQEDEMGHAMQPSYFIDRLKRIFPKNECKNSLSFGKQYLPISQSMLVTDFCKQLVTLSDSNFNGAFADTSLSDASFLQIVKKKYPQEYQRILQGYFYHNCDSVLDKKLTKPLYGENLVYTVSKLETYAGCAYQFFLQYGLNLKKREEYRIETNHIGTILHAVMESFFQWVREDNIDLTKLSKKDRDLKVDMLTRECANQENKTIFEENFRNRHQLEVFVRIAQRSMENLCRHLVCGDMQPTYFEKSFSPEDQISYIDMLLKEDIQMQMRGIVDRVDVKEMEDAVYVKVIDYKSGAKDIDYRKMYEGRQLQLTVYMNVMLELLQKQYPDKKIISTGMYYFHLHDPIIEEHEEESLEKKRIESSRLTGLVSDLEECRSLMDGKTGMVTPVRYKKDGELDSRNASLVTQEELETVSGFVRKKMIDIGNDIVDGQISMNPEKGELSSPCNFCDYQSICRFEPGVGGNAYRIASQQTKQEAKDKILNHGKEEIQKEKEFHAQGGADA